MYDVSEKPVSYIVRGDGKKFLLIYICGKNNKFI